VFDNNDNYWEKPSSHPSSNQGEDSEEEEVVKSASITPSNTKKSLKSVVTKGLSALSSNANTLSPTNPVKREVGHVVEKKTTHKELV
jgi:hypothetical protein